MAKNPGKVPATSDNDADTDVAAYKKLEAAYKKLEAACKKLEAANEKLGASAATRS